MTNYKKLKIRNSMIVPPIDSLRTLCIITQLFKAVVIQQHYQQQKIKADLDNSTNVTDITEFSI
jgi:hypothetical protein